MSENNAPVLAWYSAGITSAVACKIAIEESDHPVRVIFFETGNHHPDNERFIAECEGWYGQEIEIRRSEKYHSVQHVLVKDRYLNGPTGARCTLMLKKQLRYDIQNELGEGGWHRQVFGFEYDRKEVNRALRFMDQYPNTKPWFPLIQRRLDKNTCAKMVMDAGIELPEMYRLGYTNNNCIGCVKGGMGYWNKIRQDFPTVFNRMAKIERHLERTCIRRNKEPVYLDELDPEAGRDEKPITGECGVVCATDFLDMEDPRVQGIMDGGLNLD